MKRSFHEGITVNDLFLLSIITVNSRQLSLVNFADIFTRNKFEANSQRTFAMIKPECYTQTGKILDAIA
jgi:nucleoside-diphosphate kinase